MELDWVLSSLEVAGVVAIVERLLAVLVVVESGRLAGWLAASGGAALAGMLAAEEATEVPAAAAAIAAAEEDEDEEAEEEPIFSLRPIVADEETNILRKFEVSVSDDTNEMELSA